MNFINSKVNGHVLIAGCFMLLMFGYYFPSLPNGLINRGDEYFTLNRSFNILVNHDWFNITYLEQVVLNKPPLQYWLTALAIRQFNDLEFALRIWPFIFGFGLLIATGYFTYIFFSKRKLLATLSILILASSEHLWLLSTSAMLDTGSAFFMMLTLALFFHAKEKPSIALLLPISITLGSLQKSPSALFIAIFLALYFLLRAKLIDQQKIGISNINRYYLISAGLTLIGVLVWPLIQLYLHGSVFFEQSYLLEASKRFQLDSDSRMSAIKILEWIVKDSPACWLLALVSIPVTYKKLSADRRWIPAAWVILFFLFLTLAKGHVYQRYTLLLHPILSAQLAYAIACFSRKELTAYLIAIALMLIGHPFLDTKKMYESRLQQYMPLIEKFNTERRGDDVPVYCLTNLTDPAQESYSRTRQHLIGAFAYYAMKGKPFNFPKNIESLEQLTSDKQKRFIGICNIYELEKIKQPIKRIMTTKGFVLWTTDVAK